MKNFINSTSSVHITENQNITKCFSRLFNFSLFFLQIYYSFQTYELYNENISLLQALVCIDIDIINVAYLPDVLVNLIEAAPSRLKNSPLFPKIIQALSSFPIINLVAFILLAALSSIFIPHFGLGYCIKTAVIDYLLHQSIHFLHKDKHLQWRKCNGIICTLKSYL